jgi:ribosomal protein S18 acetylase RimI-like enzyme
MLHSGWQAIRPGKVPAWLQDLEPLTTGLLGQADLKLWCVEEKAALGIRAGGVIYPVWLESAETNLEAGARPVLDRVGAVWCLMGPAAWVQRTEALMPPSRVQRRVLYDFLAKPTSTPPLPAGLGEPRPAGPADAERLFPLQEAYEKEEVLFDSSEFHPLASRVHWSQALRQQEMVALWENDQPVAKAGTNALTPRWAQIGGVFTVPGRRGQGLQRRLMAYFLGRLANQGRGACLFVKKGNEPALGLYRTLGFQFRGDFLITYGERRAWGRGLQ